MYNMYRYENVKVCWHAEIDTICTYMPWLCITFSTNDVYLVCVGIYIHVYMCACVVIAVEYT